MKLQNLTVIFIIIIIPIVLLTSFYISTGLRTIKYQTLYDTGLLTATHDAIYAFELNTANSKFSENPEVKRDILKSSVKMFEKSLSNTCNISSYDTKEIEKYIPAIVFGMYDGFYMYAPSYNVSTGKYAHSLKNYVYYSETLEDGTVIMYSLDNYVIVSGKFDGTNYEVKEGYLIDGCSVDGRKYKGIDIIVENSLGNKAMDAIKYYKEAYQFTNWFNNYVGKKAAYLKIDSNNDPENENSPFVQHKRTVIKNKIEGVLNSSITAYSDRAWGRLYKMPKLTEEDWQKIYSNISMITFFQGKKIGLINYNGYCVLNSTNNKEYVNPNLMYFISSDGDNTTQDYYHDIRCSKCSGTLTGYKIGSFEKRKIEETDESGNTTTKYEYDHDELACYDCVSGTLSTQNTVYDYVKADGSANLSIKTAYWTSLARERYDITKITTIEPITYTVVYNSNGGTGTMSTSSHIYDEPKALNANVFTREGYQFAGWATSANGSVVYSDGQSVKNLAETNGAKVNLYAKWEVNAYTVAYNANGGSGSMTTSTFRYGTESQLGKNTFTRQNHIFVGWATSATGSTVYYDRETVKNLATSGTVTLYAVWKQDAVGKYAGPTYFNGTSDSYILGTPNHPTINANGKDSMVLNVTFSTVNKTCGHVQMLAGTAEGSGWGLHFETDGYLRFMVRIGTNESYSNTTYKCNYNFINGRKYNVTAIYNAGYLKLYIYDGSAMTIYTCPANGSGKMTQVDVITTMIGANPSSGTGSGYDWDTNFYGTINNLKLWYNMVLNEKEITSLAYKQYNSNT